MACVSTRSRPFSLESLSIRNLFLCSCTEKEKYLLGQSTGSSVLPWKQDCDFLSFSLSLSRFTCSVHAKCTTDEKADSHCDDCFALNFCSLCTQNYASSSLWAGVAASDIWSLISGVDHYVLSLHGSFMPLNECWSTYTHLYTTSRRISISCTDKTRYQR